MKLQLLVLTAALPALFDVRSRVKPAALTWEGAKGKVGETVTLKARLTEASVGGKGIGGVVVRFWMDRGTRWAPPHVGNIHLCQGTTNVAGSAECSVKLNAAALTYTGHAQAEVDPQVWNVTKAGDPVITIDKAPVHLALTGPSFAYQGQSITLKTRLTRTTDGSPIKGALLGGGANLADDYIPGMKTDDNGEVTSTFQVPGGPLKRRFTARFLGNDNYLPGHAEIAVTTPVPGGI